MSKVKPLSFSEMSLFWRDRKEHYRRYVLGEKSDSTFAMDLGKLIHSYIENPQVEIFKEMKKLEVPRKQQVIVRKLMNKVNNKRLPEREVCIQAETRDGIPLVVVYDGLDTPNLRLGEYKTSDRNEAWTQWLVNQNKQLSFYAYVWYLSRHQYFREIVLYYLNTAKGTCATFKTARGPADIYAIQQLIQRTVAAMQKDGIWEKRLTKEMRKHKDNLQLPLVDNMAKSA